MHRSWKLVLPLLAVACAFGLVSRSAPADPIGVVVTNASEGIIVTVNTEAANIHFAYVQQCDSGKPCYEITAGQGMVGIPASAAACQVKMGTASTPTAIQCPDNSPGSIQFNMTNGGTWSAYYGGAGQHAGTNCSPARVIVKTGRGANSINTWDGCHEVVYCNSFSGAISAIESDASDDIHGNCTGVIKH